jgi:AcrR family transcriptional regulator
MAPSRDYVPPSSGFFFAPGVEKTSLTTYLPSKSMVDSLIEHYWEAVHVIAKTVHRPSFERHLQRFWDNLHAGVEPRFSFQAVLFAALLTSIVSMSEEKVVNKFGVDKRSLVDNFRQGTEAALAKANFLRTTKLETMQAFVMYLVSHPLHVGHYRPDLIYFIV